MKIEHTEVRIQKVWNQVDGTCVAKIGAKTTEIYDFLFKQLLRRKIMEISVSDSSYGITGVFIAQNETLLKKAVREIKEGQIARTKSKKIKRNFKWPVKDSIVKARTTDQIHKTWTLSSQITIEV
jgi:hypothetical protein